MNGRVFRILIVGALSLCLSGAEGVAVTVFVDANAVGDGSGLNWANACTTVTAGLALSATGDQVWVKSATYPEAISLKGAVGLYGGFPSEGSPGLGDRDWRIHETVIDATGLSSSVVSAVSVEDATIDGFTITGGEAEQGGGVYASDSVLRLENCTITGNRSTLEDPDSYYGAPGGGGVGSFSSDLQITNCIITENISAGRGGGIFSEESNSLWMIGCVVARNRSGEGAAGVDGDGGEVWYCTVVDNRSRDGIGGIGSFGFTEFRLWFCILWNDGREFGEWVWNAYDSPIVQCCIQTGEDLRPEFRRVGIINADPLFEDRENGNYRLRDGSPCLNRPSGIDEWWGDIPSEWETEDLDGRPRSGLDGVTDIGAYEALDVYLPGVTVHVPRVLRVRNDAPEGGDGSSWETACNSITAAMRVASTSDEIWVAEGTYREAVHAESTTSLYGGFTGMEGFRDPRNPWVHRTVIDAFGLGCRALTGSVRQQIDGLVVTGGDADEGGGLNVWQGPTVVSRCTIEDNRAETGGGAYVGIDVSFVNSVVSGNFADSIGGGIYLERGGFGIFNCTIVGNTAGYVGSGVFSEAFSRAPTVTNCILRNPGLEISFGPQANPSLYAAVSYSCIQGGWPGEGNIDGDVYFVDPGNGDFHLQPGSACIDAATMAAAPTEDYEGVSRPGGDGLVDMGAFESPDQYEPGPSAHVPRVLFVRPDAAPEGDGLSWGSAFPTIGEALAVSGASDEIWVAGGDYHEAIVLESSVSVYGGFTGVETTREDRYRAANETVVDAGGLGRSAVTGADASLLDGFTVTGGNAESGGGVSCDYAAMQLVNCIISGNTATLYGGGVFCQNSVVNLENCLIVENEAPTGSALYGTWGGRLSVVNCTIAGNRATGGSAVSCLGAPPVMTNCILWNPGTEILYSGSQAAPMNSSCIQGGWEGEGIVDTDPMFVDPVNGDYRLSDGSPCIDRGDGSAAPADDIEEEPRPGADGLVDMGAYESPAGYIPGPGSHAARVIHVRPDAPQGGDGSSWATALPTIMEAMDIASTSDEIWLAEGTYHESVLMERSVSLYGGFAGVENLREERDWSAHQTIISATGLGTRPVTAAEYTVLDGLTLTGGRADAGGGVCCAGRFSTITNCAITGNTAEGDGGGLYIARWGTVTLSDCVVNGNEAGEGGGINGESSSTLFALRCEISENRARQWAGGLSVSSAPSPTILEDCTIMGNQSVSGGGIECVGGSIQMTRCTISENSAQIDGGGLRISSQGSSASRLEQCTIAGNTAGYGGGILVTNGASPVWDSCRVIGNAAETGGGLCTSWNASPTLRNCLVAENSASHPEGGGGIFSEWESSPHLINCTISGNSAPTGSGLFASSDALPRMENCILWNDGLDEIAVDSVTPQITWSDVRGGWTGEGNIAETPAFAYPWDGTFGDYQLLPVSPCIDAGSNEAAAGIPFDLEGNERIWDGDGVPGAVIDMGAYEFGPAKPTPTVPPTPSPTPTVTATATATATATSSMTPTVTATATATSSMTPTVTETPRPTETPTVTPTTVPGDVTGDGVVDARDLFHFSLWWRQPENGVNKACDRVDDGMIDEYDLECLMMDWK